MKNVLKNLILIILIIAVIAGIVFLVYTAGRSINYNKEAKNPILTLEVQDYGDVKIELQPDYAPNTVATIVKLVQNGYYDGKIFYGTDSRAVTAGMTLKTEEVPSEQEGVEPTTTQTAQEDDLRVSDLDKKVTPYISEEDENFASTDEDKRGNEDEDYKVSISGEFVANGFNDNTIRFEKGTVGLYRSNYEGENLNEESYNSGNSLFFITTDEDSTLNGEYAAFGKVIEGMDLIEKMLTLPLEEEKKDDEGNSTGENTAGEFSDEQKITKFASGSFPVITKAKVETYGVDYKMPKYEKAFDYDKYMSDLILQYYRNQ